MGKKKAFCFIEMQFFIIIRLILILRRMKYSCKFILFHNIEMHVPRMLLNKSLTFHVDTKILNLKTALPGGT